MQGEAFLLMYIKGTVMQIEKALINDRIRVSKVSLLKLRKF